MEENKPEEKLTKQQLTEKALEGKEKEVFAQVKEIAKMVGIKEEDNLYFKRITIYLGEQLRIVAEDICADLGCDYTYAMGILIAACSAQTLTMTVAREARLKVANEE